MKNKLRYKDREADVRVGDVVNHEEGDAKVREVTADWQVLIQFDSAKVRPNWRLLKPEEVGAYFTAEESVKPPLGLRPRFIWIAERVEEIRDAIERYEAAKVSVPRAWRSELMALVGSALIPTNVDEVELSQFSNRVQYQPAYSVEQLSMMRNDILPILVGLGPIDVEVLGKELINRAQNDEQIIVAYGRPDENYLYLIAFLLNNAVHILKDENNE